MTNIYGYSISIAVLFTNWQSRTHIPHSHNGASFWIDSGMKFWKQAAVCPFEWAYESSVCVCVFTLNKTDSWLWNGDMWVCAVYFECYMAFYRTLNCIRNADNWSYVLAFSFHFIFRVNISNCQPHSSMYSKHIQPFRLSATISSLSLFWLHFQRSKCNFSFNCCIFYCVYFFLSRSICVPFVYHIWVFISRTMRLFSLTMAAVEMAENTDFRSLVFIRFTFIDFRMDWFITIFFFLLLLLLL